MTARRAKRLDLPPGIRRRHARSCPAVESDDLHVCTCRPSYQAQAGPRTDRRTATMRTLGAARTWKRDTERAFERGEITGERAPRLREVVADWLDRVERGVVLARGGRPYRPSTLAEYRSALERVVVPDLGGQRVDAITRGDLNAWIQQLQGRGLAPQTVKNTVVPLRAVFRDAIDLELVTRNPTLGVRVPSGGGTRCNVVAPAEISGLLGALSPKDRALWATAIYAGLRRGELMALRWADVDLRLGVVTVRQAYDPGSRTFGPVKTAAGQDRRIATVPALATYLAAHAARPRHGDLVFARGTLAGRIRGMPAAPFSDQTVGARAKAAWEAGGVQAVGLHDCRHTFASLMIAAMAHAGRFNPKALQDLLGHASIQLTYDRYGHLFPGTHTEAGDALAAFLTASETPIGPALRLVAS